MSKKESNGTPSKSSLFTDPALMAAKAALSDEEKAKYARIGKEMYGDFNYETGRPEGDMCEAAAYVVEGLKSGLHPSMMDDDEKNLMKEMYGETWWEQFGYVEGDLKEIVTVCRDKGR